MIYRQIAKELSLIKHVYIVSSWTLNRIKNDAVVGWSVTSEIWREGKKCQKTKCLKQKIIRSLGF